MLDEKKILKSFNKSVSKVLALKKALGHYSVVWNYDKQNVKIKAQDLPEYPYKD